MMPAGVFVKTLPHWPAMMATLTPAYMGVAQSAYDFTVTYLRGELPGQPPIDRRVYPTKRSMAIRTCGGQSMLKTLPLERIYRDSRCGALMLPYTTEIMEDYLSMMSVYDMHEIDDAPNDTASARTSLWRPYAA